MIDQNYKNEKESLKLSVIVPMYNVEPYVERCIRSLEEQDIEKDEYEIICINDGSPDRSKDIVLDLKKEFDNILLIDQENQGVSMARNNGIEKASGKYLLMIDPDDFVKPNYFRNKLNIIENNDLEIGITGYIILDEQFKEEYRYDPDHKEEEVLSGIDYSYKHLRGKTEIRDPHRSVAIFYKTQFLKNNDLIYLKDVPYLEDGELLARIMCLANRVLYISDPFYLRTTRPGSATHSSLAQSNYARFGFLKSAKNLKKFSESSGINRKQKVYLNQPIIHFTLLYITSVKMVYIPLYYLELNRNLKKSLLSKLDICGCSKFYTKAGKYYNFSFILFYLFWVGYKLKISFKSKIGRFLILIRINHM